MFCDSPNYSMEVSTVFLAFCVFNYLTSGDAFSLGDPSKFDVKANEDFYNRMRDMLREKEYNGYEHNFQPLGLEIEEVVDWPKDPKLGNLGEVSGVDVDLFGNVHIFQRSNRTWTEKSFDGHHLFQQKSDGPIQNDTVIIISADNGTIIRSWGKNRFYLPHGITIDLKGNTWLTDVALHQVFKFEPNKTEPSLVLGEAFAPGNDDGHFCKPTDVAVASSGIFYVSDGYCNSRILMYTADGTLIQEIGTQDGMIVPHSIALFEQEDVLCVADRENRRILCYSAALQVGSPDPLLAILEHPQMGRIFSISQKGDLLFALNGPEYNLFPVQSSPNQKGLIINMNSGDLMATWSPMKGFDEAHDLSVSPDGSAIYVAQIGSSDRKILKFKL